MLGEAYFKLDKLKDAEFWYREALRVKSDHIPAHLTYGKLLTRMVSQILRFCYGPLTATDKKTNKQTNTRWARENEAHHRELVVRSS